MIQPLSRPLLKGIGDELNGVADSLCALACDLAGDAAVIERHFDQLQSIDLMVQIQRALADLLQGTGTDAGRVGAIPVEALAARLSAALDAIPQAA